MPKQIERRKGRSASALRKWRAQLQHRWEAHQAALAAGRRWSCPACATEIHHRADSVDWTISYRCPVCRLDFIMDGATQTLALAPMTAVARPRAATATRRNEPARTKRKQSA